MAKRRILVVDDDDPVRHLFALALDDIGLPVVEAANGAQALREVAAGDVALIVLDNLLPDMRGIELVKLLRSSPEWQTVPVVMVTAVNELPERLMALEAGAIDYLVKPVEVEELAARVRAQLRSQDAWSGVLDRVRSRLSTAAALSRISADTAPEVAAAAVCKELQHLDPESDIAIYAFLDQDTAVRLADTSDRQVHDRSSAASRPRARQLWEMAGGGPRLETVGLPLLDLTAAIPGIPVPRAEAYAPLQLEGAQRGVVVLSTDATRVHDPVGHLADRLPAVLDLAPMMASLLGPVLERGNQVQGRRAELQHVLREDAFTTVFQPIVDLGDGRVVGYEALTRFQDGTRPDLRMAEAAALGLGLEYEVATLEAALDAGQDLPADAWLSINVSPGFLLETGRLEALLARSPRQIVLELTEHDPISDYAAIRASLAALGPELKLSIDDAGAGYACLRHVLDLHPTFVKLDRAWVDGIDRDPARQALAAGLAYFARRMGCVLVAEGIETAEQLATVTALGVELGQGFLLGQPMAPALT